MTELWLAIIVVLLVVTVVIEIMQYRKNVTIDLPRIQQSFAAVEKSHQEMDRSVKEALAKHREDALAASRQAHEELAKTLREVAATLNQQFDGLREAVDERLGRLQDDTAKMLGQISEDSRTGAKKLRDEIATSLKGLNDSVGASLRDASQAQKTQLDAVAGRLDKLQNATGQQVDALKIALETGQQSLRDDTAAQLKQARAAADERLQRAEKQLGDAFKQVGDRVDQASRELGKLQAAVASAAKPAA